VAIYFTTFGGFIAMTAWLPVYWTSFHSVTPILAGTLAGVYSIVTSLVRVGGGYLSDRIGGETTGILALAIMLAGAILMTLSGDFQLSVAAEIIMAVGMGVANAAVFQLVAQEVPEAVGGAAGWALSGGSPSRRSWGPSCSCRGSKATRTGSWSSSAWRWPPCFSSGS